MEDISAALLIEEDISILTTNRIPSAEDANAIKSRNTERKEIIRESYERIAALQALCHKLTVACEIGEAIVAPIRCIPREILEEILVQCIPSLPTMSSKCTRNSHPHPQDVVELLGSVCHRWRTIVHDTPRIWSTLVLDRSIRAPEDVYKYLVKSKSCPLDILIHPCQWFRHRHEQVKKCTDVLGVLRSQLWRIQTLVSDMHCHSGAVIFPNGFSINSPIMQTLSYTDVDPPHIDDDYPRFNCPKLRSVSLRDCEPMVRSLVANPVQTVRHLAVCFSRNQTLYLDLLRTLPNLVSLHWSGYRKLPEIPQAVVLKSLKSLRLDATESVMDVLSCLHVPSLESLELLVGVGYGQFVYDAICALCGDGSVKLRRLHIVHGELPVRAIRSLLRQLDRLETLIIERSDEVEGLLIALAPPDQDFSLVCPHLTTLVIAESDFYPEPLIEFVYRRMQADSKETAPGFVKCLKLTKTGELFTALSRYNFLRTHRATIHLMLRMDYHFTPLVFSTTLPERRYGWDV